MATKPPSGSPLNAGHALTDGLLHVWAMLEGTGDTTADSKSNLTGVLTDGSPPGGPTWASDAEGPGLTGFTGLNRVETTTSSIGLTDPDTLTFLCRVTTPSNITGRFTIYSPNNEVAGVPEWEIGNGSGIAGSSSLILPGVAFVAVGATALIASTTYTLGYTRAGAGDTHTFYKDGSAVADSLTTNEALGYANPTQERVIGARDNAGAQPFSGEIWWFVVWDRALSAAEIALATANPFAIFRLPVRLDNYKQPTASGLSVAVS